MTDKFIGCERVGDWIIERWVDADGVVYTIVIPPQESEGE